MATTKKASPARTKCSNKKHETLVLFLLKPCIVSAWSATKTTRHEAAQYTESLPTHDVWKGFFVCISQKKMYYCGVAAEPTDSIFYVYKDYLGSLLTFTNETPKVIYEQSFDAWGRYRNTEDWSYEKVQHRPRWMYRGYTGHEHLYGFVDVPGLDFGLYYACEYIVRPHDAFNLINMNGRLYDPVNGRMLSVDNYSHDGLGSQGYNRYTYAGNNPLKYTDPSGESIAGAMAIGAIVGAFQSSIIYLASTAITGGYSGKGLGRAALSGAITGALGGFFGSVATSFGAFGNSIAYNLTTNAASNLAATAATGGKITFGSVIGSIVGSLAGGAIGGFNGVKGGALLNIGAELAFGIAKGAFTGAISGGFAAAIDGGDGNDIGIGITQGAKQGAIAGRVMSAMAIGAFGSAYVPENVENYGDFGFYKPVYRRGTILTRALAEGGGITIGRNLMTNRLNPNKTYYASGAKIDVGDFNNFLGAHETGHYDQQINMGFGNFYTNKLLQGFNISSYLNPSTLEGQANQYSVNKK